MTAIKDLTDAQAGHGSIIYNGYRFGAFRNFSISLVPEYDDAGRALVGNRLTLELTECISDDSVSDMNTRLLAMRRQLAEPGQVLVIAGVGFGDMSINGINATPALAKTHDDIEWGPKPEPIEFTPLGGNVSWEFTWRVTAFIRDCPGTIGGPLAFASFNYRTVYSRNEEGLTQRIISGRARIAQTRVNGGRTLTKSADQLWDKVNIPIPQGFGRANSTHQVDESKCWLEFVVVDEELPGEAPPEHMIQADIDYDLESVPPGFERYEATLSGTLTVAPGKAPSRAASAFWLIAFDKLRKLQQAARPKGVVIPTRLKFGHKLFTRSSRFSISFSVVHCLEDILRSGGIWAPVEGSNYQKWRASMNEVFSSRGVAGLRQTPTDDMIVDLCGNFTYGTAGRDISLTRPDSWEPSGLLRMDGITSENSWFGFENTLKIQRDESVSLSKVVRNYTPYGSAPETDGVAFDAVTGYTESAVAVEYGSSPEDTILMYGKALRLKFQPSVPRLEKIGNVTVTQIKQLVDGPRPIACFFGVPVYLVRWAILYKANGHISKVPPPQQALCCETDQKADTKGGVKKT